MYRHLISNILDASKIFHVPASNLRQLKYLNEQYFNTEDLPFEIIYIVDICEEENTVF